MPSSHVQDGTVDYPYHYVPTQYVTIIFVVLFSISTIIHTGQLFYYRMWWLLPTIFLCGITEIAGWSARLWSSISPTLGNPFTIQITTTIIAPTPLVAANFVILGMIIQAVGPMYSRLTPKWYTIIFCSCDVISLVIQGLGGGIASVASNSTPSKPKTAKLGGNIMLGGIIFQLVTLTIYAFFAGEFFARYIKRNPVRPTESAESLEKPWTNDTGRHMTYNQKFMSIALGFSTLFLFIRSVYRTIELADGWNGRIISTQVYFNVLDGAMVTLAIFTLNLAHPGRLLGHSRSHRGNPEPPTGTQSDNNTISG